MKRLNVRCCCTPMKIFGTLPVPEEAVQIGAYAIVMLKPAGERRDDDPNPAETHTIKIKEIVIPAGANGRFFYDREMAIYSEDRPIEFWRRVPGFIEAEHA